MRPKLKWCEICGRHPTSYTDKEGRRICIKCRDEDPDDG